MGVEPVGHARVTPRCAARGLLVRMMADTAREGMSGTGERAMASDRLILDRTASALAKAASCIMARQRAIVANIVNADTPGYRPARVEFEEALEAALKAEKRAGRGWRRRPVIASVTPRIYADPSVQSRLDGNGVNLEREVAKLIEASVQHEAVVRLLAHKLRLLEIAISDTGGRV